MTHERHAYREDCPGCQLALLDPATGRALAPDDPIMVAAMRVWNAAPFEERAACNRVWVHESRVPEDLRSVAEMGKRIARAIALDAPDQVVARKDRGRVRWPS
jgi:hypothetical protein